MKQNVSMDRSGHSYGVALYGLHIVPVGLLDLLLDRVWLELGGLVSP